MSIFSIQVMRRHQHSEPRNAIAKLGNAPTFHGNSLATLGEAIAGLGNALANLGDPLATNGKLPIKRESMMPKSC